MLTEDCARHHTSRTTAGAAYAPASGRPACASSSSENTSSWEAGKESQCRKSSSSLSLEYG
eukprot:scaffold2926_cov399-Prasinococcus_capsulatus_cf.AAC.13